MAGKIHAFYLYVSYNITFIVSIIWNAIRYVVTRLFK